MNALAPVLAPVDEYGLSQALILDDRSYFRAGALIERIGACAIVHTPGLEHMDAGCMVEGGAAVAAELPRLAARLRALGASSLRLYVAGNVELHELEGRGFERTLEPCLILPVDAPAPRGRSGAVIRRITRRDDLAKTALFASDRKLPDGKDADPDEYVALERRKIDAGYMDGFFVVCEGQVAATFGLSAEGPVLRLKNIFVSPAWRGQRLVETLVAFGQAQAAQLGLDAVGVFALAGSSGHRAYLRAGMWEAGVQTEYAAPLNSLNGKY